MFVARNKDGMLLLFEGLPQRMTNDVKTKDFCYKKDEWAYVSIFSNCDNERSQHHFSSKILDPNLFPNLKWEDKPLEVKLFTDKQIECLENDAYERGWDSCSEMEAEFEEHYKQ